MEDTFVNVDPRSHARQLEMEEIFDSSFFGTNQRAAPSKADQQLRVLLDLARQEKIRDEYSEAEWRNNLEMQDRLLRAAKVQHGSRGRIVQDILHSDKFIPLGQKAYAELGFSYLHQAAWEGLHEIIDEIIQLENSNGKDDPVNEFCVVTIEDEKFELPMTPLQIAAFRGHYKVVELLLNCQGIKIAGITNSNYSMEYVFTPLHLAAAGGHLKVVKLLLGTVKQVGDLDFEEFLNSKDGIENFRRTALHYACRNGNTEVVKELLSQEGIDKEVKDALGYTPALLAVVAEGDNEDIVELFFEDIPDPSIPSFLTDHIHFSPPDPKENFGIEYGNLTWQVILIWPNLVDSYYIDTYCYCVLPTLVKEDFDKGWKLSNEDIYFFSATRLAVLGNNGMVLDCLLKHIVPMAKKDEKLIPSQTFYVDSTNINKMIDELMHYAARIGSSEALKVLLHFKPASTKGYKLDINSKMCGTTAAFIAVQNLYRFAHVKVNVKDEEYNLRLWRGFLCIVNNFCLMEEFDSIDRDSKDNILVYYISEVLNVLPQLHIDQKNIRETYVEAAVIKMTSSSAKLNRFYEYYGGEKQNLQNGCNAILVGATLIASLAFSGMLQPPIPSGCSEGKVNKISNTYWTFNSLAFYFAVYTMISCLKVLMPRRREYIEEELKRLTRIFRHLSIELTMTITLAVGAYMQGERLNELSRKVTYQNRVFGIVFLVPFFFVSFGKDYWRLIAMLKDSSNWRHFAIACRRVYIQKIPSWIWICYRPCNFSSSRTSFNSKRYKKGPSQAATSTRRPSIGIRKMKTRDPSVSEKYTSHNKGLSRQLHIVDIVDDVDILKTTCQVLFMHAAVIGAIIVVVLNLSIKLDGC